MYGLRFEYTREIRSVPFVTRIKDRVGRTDYSLLSRIFEAALKRAEADNEVAFAY